MNYIEALQRLVDGKRIREKNWDKDDYVYLEEGVICTKVGNDTGLDIGIEIRHLQDITGDNWEIYQTEEDKLIQAGKRLELYMACIECKSCNNCERIQNELYKVCNKENYTTARNAIYNLSDEELNKLYNTLKGEIDA